MNVVLSRPLTMHRDSLRGSDFVCIGDESRLSWLFRQRFPLTFSDYLLQLCYIGKFFCQRHGTNAIITGRFGELFSTVQGFFPIRKIPHLLLDIEWPYRHNGWFRRLFTLLYHRMIAAGAWKIQVFCEEERRNYSAYYGIDPAKFVWIPYCTNSPVDHVPTKIQDYVFSGGWQHRDYPTLFRAVSQLPYDVLIAAPNSSLVGCTVPANVKLLGPLSRDAFLQYMAQAKLVVLSLQSGLMRYPGVITYVTALRMGKCVIVNDPHGARSYIQHRETGYLVPENDPDMLAHAIDQLWISADHRHYLATQASVHAANQFSLERLERDLAQLLSQHSS